MFKASKNTHTNNIRKLFIYGMNHTFIRKKIELIENRNVFQLLPKIMELLL